MLLRDLFDDFNRETGRVSDIIGDAKQLLLNQIEDHFTFIHLAEAYELLDVSIVDLLLCHVQDVIGSAFPILLHLDVNDAAMGRWIPVRAKVVLQVKDVHVIPSDLNNLVVEQLDEIAIDTQFEVVRLSINLHLLAALEELQLLGLVRIVSDADSK